MKADDLYLGYYLHLIQDLLYRHFMYDRYHWNPKPDGNIERLHDDYKQINAYVISKYGLHSDIHVPNGFASEKINELADFEPDRFIQELYSYHISIIYQRSSPSTTSLSFIPLEPLNSTAVPGFISALRYSVISLSVSKCFIFPIYCSAPYPMYLASSP